MLVADPHRIDEAIDKIDLQVTVDGIPMDAHAHGFIRALTMSTTIQNNDSFTVSAYKSRPEMRFPVPQKPSAPTVIGTPKDELVRHRAWIVGSLFRLYRQPADSERVYVAVERCCRRRLSHLPWAHSLTVAVSNRLCPPEERPKTNPTVSDHSADNSGSQKSQESLSD